MSVENELKIFEMRVLHNGHKTIWKMVQTSREKALSAIHNSVWAKGHPIDAIEIIKEVPFLQDDMEEEVE